MPVLRSRRSLCVLVGLDREDVPSRRVVVGRVDHSCNEARWRLLQDGVVHGRESAGTLEAEVEGEDGRRGGVEEGVGVIPSRGDTAAPDDVGHAARGASKESRVQERGERL